MKLKAFRAASCQKTACWRKECFSDGGVTVALGSGWNAFMLDKHFADKHGCVGKGGRRGEMCDAVALHAQASNKTIRLIEAKRGASMSSKLALQLQHGADYVDGIVGAREVVFTAELHTGPGPRITVRSRAEVRIASRDLRVPITIHRAE